MDIQCQLMLHPLAVTDYQSFIEECFEVLTQFPISYSMATMNVLVHGDEKDVFEAVQALFSFAHKKHPYIILHALYTTAFSYS